MVVLLLLEVWVGPPLRGFRREWEDGKSLGVARHRHRPCTGQGWRLATAWWHWWCSLAVRSRICASVGGALCAVRCPRKQGSSGDEGLRRSIRVARGSAPPPPQRQQPQQQEQPLSLSRLSEGVVALVVFVGGALAYLRERRRRTVRRPVPSQARQQRRRGTAAVYSSSSRLPQRQQPQQQEQPLSLSRLSLSRLDRPQRASRAADACDGARMR